MWLRGFEREAGKQRGREAGREGGGMQASWEEGKKTTQETGNWSLM